MTLDELREIFKPQLDRAVPYLLYMLPTHHQEEPRTRLEVYKCKETDIQSLIPKLSGREHYLLGDIPRFI